jgi:hypothetical protein
VVVFMNTTGFELCASAPVVSTLYQSLSLSLSRSLSHGRSGARQGLSTSMHHKKRRRAILHRRQR